MNEYLVIYEDGTSGIHYLDEDEVYDWRLDGCQVLPVEERLGSLSIREIGVNQHQVLRYGRVVLNIIQIS
jgi:hypothetical protein